jgi:DNA-binding FadR family transcriptional regulator
MAAAPSTALVVPAASTMSPTDPESKLAASVARRILTDVVDRGWPVGEVLGSQAELIERYGVSRAVFREAVRLVENQQVATMRRGPGGGLVVTEPTVDAIIDAAVLYLHRANTRLDEVFEARIVLEVIAAELATERLTEEDAGELRTLEETEVRDHRALHARLAAMTRNPALELFVDILNRVAFLYFRGGAGSLGESTLSASRDAHARIISAVLDHEPDTAARRMRRHIEAESAFLQNRKLSRQFLSRSVALGGGVSNKRAEDVARAILQDVVADDLPPGTLLGSQAALIEKYGASRAVFREALRLLEHHQIATMRRGPGGGLFVSAPSGRAVSDVVAVYLARRDISMADLVELRIRVELAQVELAIARAHDHDVGNESELHHALAHEDRLSLGEFADGGHDLHAVIAGLAGNRALELVSLVLIRLMRLHQVEQVTDEERAVAAVEVSKAHGAIASAITDGDVEVARRRLRRHLEALGSYLR